MKHQTRNVLFALSLGLSLIAASPSIDITPMLALAALPISPLNSPVPPGDQPSEYALIARAAIALREQAPETDFAIFADHPTVLAASQRDLQIVGLEDKRRGHIYKLAVDRRTRQIEEDLSQLTTAEAEAHQARYGKLDDALYQRLQRAQDDDDVPVAIWMGAAKGQSAADVQYAAYTTLANKYPAASDALAAGRKPMDIADKALAKQIEAEYNDFVTQVMRSRTGPLLSELHSRGLAVTEIAGMPLITGDLPKTVILEINKRADVSTIHLAEAKAVAALDSVAPTVLAPTVWAYGHDGTGHTIAILDIGNIDTSNNYLHLSGNRRIAGTPAFNHATETASVAASFHSTYKGIAPGASIMSIGSTGTESDIINGTIWAFDYGAEVLNASIVFGTQADTDLHLTDRAFDYWTRTRNKLAVNAAGNTGNYIASPGKA